MSLLDQVIAYANEKLSTNTIRDVLGIIEENVFLDLLKLINEKNQQQLLNYINKLLNDGFSISDFISGFNEFTRHCMLYKNNNTGNYNLSEHSIDWLENKCRFNSTDILRILDLCLQFESNLKNIPNPQISLEALFMKLAILDTSIDITQLLSNKNIETKSKNVDNTKKDHTTINNIELNKGKKAKDVQEYDSKKIKKKNTPSVTVKKLK